MSIYGTLFANLAGSNAKNSEHGSDITPDVITVSSEELRSQLTNLTVAQRLHQANAQILQITNNLLSDLDQIIQ